MLYDVPWDRKLTSFSWPSLSGVLTRWQRPPAASVPWTPQGPGAGNGAPEATYHQRYNMWKGTGDLVVASLGSVDTYNRRFALTMFQGLSLPILGSFSKVAIVLNLRHFGLPSHITSHSELIESSKRR